MSLCDWISRSQALWPDVTAVVDVSKGPQARWTYSALALRASRLARWLREAGTQKGDRVGLLAPNGVEYLDLLFACAKLGALFVPFNWRLHASELSALLELTRPTVLLSDVELQPLLSQALSETSLNPRLLQLGQDEAYATVVERGAPDEAPAAELNLEDTACLLFTGGTSGLPKAAQISYRMMAWNSLNVAIHELSRGDVTLTHTPMFHTGGLLVYTLPLLMLGGTVVIMRKWDAEHMLSLLPQEKVSVLFCVPTQYQLLAEAPAFERTSFSRVRFLTSGGAPLPAQTLARWTQVHNVPFKQGFGMTEFGPGAFSMGSEFALSKRGSIGRPNYFVEARLVNEHNQAVPVETVGELLLRGPSLFSGYFANEKETAAAMDADGWFHTGDLARVDSEGFYFIVDRKKDMFISGGENIYPVEIENALFANPLIRQCAVVGVPDEKWGEVAWAFVVLQPGNTCTEELLLNELRGHLARFKVPKRIVQMDSLPLSAQGKVRKTELRKWAAAPP